ncbi:MAG: hypothetical protein Q4D93_06410, partial [Porphyromonas sp.]|nr:hypothetical protein [Porphyromonas sp.]
EIIEPSEELINKFSPDDLERLIGHEQVLTIGDCFVLLPDKVCMNTSATERRAMQVEGYTPEISYNAVLHEMNQQYLRMGPVFEGEWEMYAVEERDQLWHIAVTMKDCGPVCVETVYEFVYDNGALYQRKPAQLTAFQSITPDMFINFDLLSKEEADSIIDDWQEMTPPEGYPSCILHQLPKEGSEILMYLETMLFDTEIPDKALIEVRGTFPPSGH